MTYQSALAIVQRLCAVRGITQPSALLTATDPGIIQMRALLEDEVSQLSKRYEWQALTNNFQFNTVASQAQGYLDGNVPGSTSSGSQSVLLNLRVAGGSATGLANNSTAYTATILIDGTTTVNVSLTGSATQTYTTLLSGLNTALGANGTAALGTNVNTIQITSASTGLLSSVAITDGTTHPLFGTLTAYVQINPAVQGTSGIIPTGSGFMKIINDTLWDASRHLPLFGPRKMQDIAMLQAIPVTGPFLQYNIWNNQLNILPIPAAGDLIIGYYQSRNGWTASTGATTSEFIAADTDVPVLDSDVVYLGLKWRWLEAKGLSYAEEKQNYEFAVMDLQARDRPRTKKVLSGASAGYFDPMVILPAGSWPVQGSGIP